MAHMLLDTLKHLAAGPRPVALIFVLLLASLYLLSAATQNSLEFGRLYSLLLAVNILALLLLLALILRQLTGLTRQYRQRAPGARLTVRLVVMFVILSVVPVTMVYYFSLQFLHRSIDSWFDVRVERALEDALELGRGSLDGRLREMLRQSRLMAATLAENPEPLLTLQLNELRQQSKSVETTVLTLQGKVVASSSADPTDIVPALPNSAILLQLSQGLDYAALEPIGSSTYQVRVVVPVRSPSFALDEARILQVIFPIAERVGTLAESVQSAFAQYKELAFLRQPLKYSFTLTLSLVLLLSLLGAVWAAFFSARRLVEPIRDLAEGTRAVAAGDYDKRLPLPSRDELGFLVGSFNEMTRKIALSREQARRSQTEVEAQRAYLEAVLERLSSGVITATRDGIMHIANAAAGHILGLPLAGAGEHGLEELAQVHPGLEPLLAAIKPHLREHSPEWRAEVVLFGPSGRQVLMCRGSALPTIGEIEDGHVIVFDDVTALIQAQRDAAWGEVARRLAHEIKNPLTPIQLSAERLRHKYLHQMAPEDAEVLDRSTHTIVQQVRTMKEMVKAFSEYAHTPAMQLDTVDLNRLITEVLDLYRNNERGLQLRLQLDPQLPQLQADSGRLRQLLHNLIKNAQEAGSRTEQLCITVTTSLWEGDSGTAVELSVRDNGPGIPEQMLAHLFEPYVTTKPKGTGLGLAIVKKIVEEHGGMLWAEGGEGSGATLVLRLPIRTHAAATTAAHRQGS